MMLVGKLRARERHETGKEEGARPPYLSLWTSETWHAPLSTNLDRLLSLASCGPLDILVLLSEK